MYKLTVKDLQGNILHEPTLETQIEALTMKSEIESFHNYNFPAHEDEQGNLVADFTVEIVDITAQVEQEKINAEALAYLASTDWLVVRSIEKPDKPIPDDVKMLRQQARDKVIK